MSVAVILGILLASQVMNRWLAFEVEEGPDGSVTTLLSPVGKFPLRKTSAGSGSLLLAIYPDAKPQEQRALDWTERPGTAAKSRSQLTVLTFQSGASLEQIDSWYQKELGSSFERSKGWPLAGKEEASAWMRQVESRTLPEAITFHKEVLHRARGVLLLPGVAGQGFQIKLYDYMETSE